MSHENFINKILSDAGGESLVITGLAESEIEFVAKHLQDTGYTNQILKINS